MDELTSLSMATTETKLVFPANLAAPPLLYFHVTHSNQALLTTKPCITHSFFISFVQLTKTLTGQKDPLVHHNLSSDRT
jgi:hypothetical protein